MKQKHYIDIQNIREEDTELRNRNTQAFDESCNIYIQEKFDGSCASCCYDPETDQMVAFSRKQKLDISKNLNGFWNYVQALPEKAVELFKAYPNFVVFGEWNNKNKIVYDDTGKISHWYVFDIYDKETCQWQYQPIVKLFCEKAGLEYINVLYSGKFISWNHVRSFLNSPAYGPKQEGIVVKNMTKLQDWDPDDVKAPCYLKIVNESFKESMKTKEKIIDPEKENAKAEAQKMMESICTVKRKKKELYKMRDEGILPEKIEPTDFRTIAQNLPKRIYMDLLKEEKEIVIACGEYASKACHGIVMSIAKDLVLGK